MASGRRPGRWARTSVRARTTIAAVVVVAIALLVGGIALVLAVRSSLHDGVESSAEQRAGALADQVERSGLPARTTDDEDDEADDPEDEVWQVVDDDGRVLRSSQALRTPLPRDDGDAHLSGADARYYVATEDAGEYDVIVALSLEEVDDTTRALLPPLLVGLPLLLLAVGATTWVVASRALAPVERIRREVEQITGDRLERRVPEPASRDEVHRLATTMNRMLGRLQAARDRQRQFVGDASHELRSPLASIRQTAEVAKAHPHAMPEGELADAVLEEGARMQRLVEQLLLLTRTDEGAPAAWGEVDLDDLAFEEARRLRDGIGIDISGVQAARVRGERAALAQVVRNLVDNAVRHATSRVRIETAAAGPWVELVVADDGAGIPEDQRERVFERFVRLDEARSRDAGGSGLGLAIVREIVHAHGGSVSVSGAPGGGARFVVRLPARSS